MRPMVNDDDIASRLHRHLMEKRPDDPRYKLPECWKVIRAAIRRWREKKPADNTAEQNMFAWLDNARQQGIIR